MHIHKHLFRDPVGKKILKNFKKLAKNVKYHKNTTCVVTILTSTNVLRLVQLFSLWSSHSWSQLLPCPKEAIADPLPKYLL